MRIRDWSSDVCSSDHLVAAELRTADTALAEEHYAEHSDKPFFGELVTFLTRSPVFAMVVEGPADNTFSLVRKMVGATKVDDAEPGTIRGDFATITTENLEIGRASCRERVGQYVSISVVAGTLK